MFESTLQLAVSAKKQGVMHSISSVVKAESGERHLFIPFMPTLSASALEVQSVGWRRLQSPLKSLSWVFHLPALRL